MKELSDHEGHRLVIRRAAVEVTRAIAGFSTVTNRFAEADRAQED